MNGGVVFWKGRPNARSTRGVSCSTSKLTVSSARAPASAGSATSASCARAKPRIRSGQNSGIGQRVKTKVSASALPR